MGDGECNEGSVWEAAMSAPNLKVKNLLAIIDKNKFKENYKLENYGINLIEQDSKLIVDKLDWKGEAKKSGIQMGDIISNFKIENPNRPNKAIIYPFALTFLLFFGYLNYTKNPNFMILFYIRRFLIQPLLLVLFIPAFFYQKKLTNK